jgi:restriction endonuclease S subunit
MQICQLKNISSIRSGYLFRGKIDADPAGQYPVLQIGDIKPDATLVPQSLTRVNLPDVRPSHLVAANEVVFISRGTRKGAIAITEPIDNVIATAQLFVLHPDETVLPAYLAWYLNQREAQQYIEENSTGTNVSLITMEALGKLPVQLPSLELQRRIVEIHKLALREKHLLAQIQAKRQTLIERTLLNTLAAARSTN